MAPKKNNNDPKDSSDTAVDMNNNSQQRQNNKGKVGKGQRVGGDGPRAKPTSRSKKAVSRIVCYSALIMYLLGCGLSCS
jgi:hypothetical protein